MWPQRLTVPSGLNLAKWSSLGQYINYSLGRDECILIQIAIVAAQCLHDLIQAAYLLDQIYRQHFIHFVEKFDMRLILEILSYLWP